MEPDRGRLGQLAAQSKEIARKLLVIGENRIELLKLEMREERELLRRSFLLAFGTATAVLLAGIALTAAIVLWLWASAPVAVLLTLTGLYGTAGVFFYRRLAGLLQDRRSFPATIDQLRKDPALFGKQPIRDPHETQKQLLIAESELNRAQLAGDIAALTAGAETVTGRARSFGSVASAAADLVMGLPAWHRTRPADNRPGTSWLPTILKGAGLISTAWLAIRSSRRGDDSKPAGRGA